MKTTFFLIGLALVLASGVAAAVPGTGGSFSSPEVDTPNVPSEPVDTQEIDSPATCTQSVCTQSTSTGPVATPPVPFCVPLNGGCLVGGTIQSIPLLPSQTVPALCATPAGAACLPATEIVPAQHQQTPGAPPQQVAPAGFVSAQYGVADTEATIPSVGIGSIENVPVVNDPPVVIYACQNTPCPFPNVTPGSISSGVTLILVVDGQQFGGSFPLGA